jgi:prepilin-type N-terminal cleavage/methylation domain-containing protein
MTAEHRQRNSEAGFTLIEALVALALTGLVLSALATLTAQFLPNWNRGIDRIQHSELIGISMQRIAADLAAAEFIPAGGDDKNEKRARRSRSPSCAPPSAPMPGSGSTWSGSARPPTAAVS